jgi:peptide/nickel transport system permease protein
MASLLFRKSIYGVLVLLGVVTAVFLLFQGIGDPARLVMGQTGDSTTLSNIRKELHLDKPRHTQLLLYVNDISPICIHRAGEIEAKGLRGFFIGGEWKAGLKVPYLRRSYQSKKEVWQILMEALPGTLLLAVAAMLIATCAGIPLGVAAATRQHGWTDRIATVGSVIGISAPSFFMGIVVAYLFGFVWQSYTGLRMTGSLYDLDPFQGKVLQLQNLMLPALTLGIRPLAIVTQLTRSAMLDVLKQDYIRTARAKGLTQRAVVWRHALPNALNPVMTSVTGWFAELLAGAFFVEYIFGWKGLGKVTVDALEKLDYPVVMGSIILTALLFVVVNMLADLLYSKLDPRIGRG